MHVLVTDDGSKASLAIVRTLGHKGIHVSVLADTPIALASCSRYCSARYLVQQASSAAFPSKLLELLSTRHFDLVMPVEYAFTAALSLHKEAILPLARLEISGCRQILAAADKRFMLDLAARCGVPVPQTVEPESLEDALDRSRNLRFPVVVKACSESVRDPIRHVQNYSDLVRTYSALCARRNGRNDPLPLIQEFIPGHNSGFFALYQKGACKRIFMHKRIRSGPPYGRVSCCAESFYDAKLKEYGKRLLDQLGWHGVAMVEFRRDQRDGDYKLMEINPRFWGSLDLAIAAGVDFPYYVCQMAQGQDLAYSEDYRLNVRYHWPLLEARHVLKRPASFFPVVADMFRPSVRSNLWWTDLKPNVLEPLMRIRKRTGKRLSPSPRPFEPWTAGQRLDQHGCPESQGEGRL